MKKFIQMSLCLAILSSAAVQTPGSFTYKNIRGESLDGAKGAGVAAAAVLLGTEQGRGAVKTLFLQDKEGNINIKHAGIAGASGLGVYLLEQYNLHNYLRSVPAVEDAAADFVEDHKVGVAVATAVAVLWLCNLLLEAAKSTTV